VKFLLKKHTFSAVLPWLSKNNIGLTLKIRCVATQLNQQCAIVDL
jgi:hypothetical protein